MNINQIITRIKTGQNDIEIYKGAAESTLSWFELQMQIALPEDFKALYRFSDGFESAEDAFRILSLDEIFNNRREKYRGNLPGKRFYFAEYMQYSDMWSVKMGERSEDEYAIFCTAKNDEQVVMTHSLANYLACFLAGGVFESSGLYAWADGIAGNDLAS